MLLAVSDKPFIVSKSPARLPREIWVLVAAAVCIALGYGIVAPVLPQFAKTFDVTTTAATIVVSAFAFMRLTFAPVSGRLSQRFGERNMYMTGIVIVALSSLLSALSQEYWQLLVFRAIGGVGSVTFTVAAMSLIIQLAPPHARGRASAAYGAGFLIGNIAGPAVGALLAPFGYRWPFVIYAGMLVIATLIVGKMIPAVPHQTYRISDLWHREESRERRRQAGELGLAEEARRGGSASAHPEQHSKHAESAAAHDEPNSKHDEPNSKQAEQTPQRKDPKSGKPLTIREAFEDPRFRIVLVTAFAQGWTNMGVRVAVVPLLAGSIVAGPEWLPGGALAVFAVGNGIALARAGYWSDVYGRRPIVILGLLLSGLFTVTLGFASSPALILGLSLMAGFGSGFVQPSQQGTVADIVGTRQGGRVVSFFQQSGDLGQILGPIVAGLLIDFYGYGAAFAVSGAILIIAALMWIIFVKPYQAPAAPEN